MFKDLFAGIRDIVGGRAGAYEIGGLHIALEYFIAGLILMITIIGIPFG